MTDLGRKPFLIDWDSITLTGLACSLQQVVVGTLHAMMVPSLKKTATVVISDLDEVSQESPVFLLSHVADQPLPCHVHIVLQLDMHL